MMINWMHLIEIFIKQKIFLKNICYLVSVVQNYSADPHKIDQLSEIILVNRHLIKTYFGREFWSSVFLASIPAPKLFVFIAKMLVLVEPDQFFNSTRHIFILSISLLSLNLFLFPIKIKTKFHLSNQFVSADCRLHKRSCCSDFPPSDIRPDDKSAANAFRRNAAETPTSRSWSTSRSQLRRKSNCQKSEIM